jgi:hypothetical protein
MFAGDLRYRTQQLPAKPAKIAASILYFASIGSFFKATRKGYTGASFYLMTTAANYTKIGEHLSLSYQAHKRHIQLSNIRFACPWSKKLFATEHTLKLVLIYLPKLFFA